MSSGISVNEHFYAATWGFLTGMVQYITVLLFTIVSKLRGISGSELITILCILLGTGILSIIASTSIVK